MAIKTGDLINATATINQIYPVGSIYISTINTNPSTYLNGTTWESFASGKVLIGVDSNDTDFNYPEKTGGAKTVTMTADNLPSHKHSIAQRNTNGNTHSHSLSVGARDCFYSQAWSGAGGSETFMLWGSGYTYGVNGNGNHAHTIPAHDTENTGSGTAFGIVNPYICVYMWKRTA